jgi:hypothetical protein
MLVCVGLSTQASVLYSFSQLFLKNCSDIVSTLGKNEMWVLQLRKFIFRNVEKPIQVRVAGELNLAQEGSLERCSHFLEDRLPFSCSEIKRLWQNQVPTNGPVLVPIYLLAMINYFFVPWGPHLYNRDSDMSFMVYLRDFHEIIYIYYI